MKDGAAEPYREFPAKATGNNRFDATPNITDWYETVKLNYGVDYQNGGTCHFSPTPDTWIKMLDILLFWASKNIDGFRCDMAEMVPVEFWEWAIPQVKEAYPEILFIAEVYNPSEYRNYLFRGKFDYLYDKVGLYDTLRNVACGYESATAITHCWQSLNGIEKKMLNFLENTMSNVSLLISLPAIRVKGFPHYCFCMYEHQSYDDLFRSGVWRAGHG